MNSKEIEEVKLTKKFARIIEPERQVLLKKVTYDKAIKCAQVAAEYRSIGEREAAIGFATWMEDGNFYRSVENGIRYYHKSREEKYTKEQLYEIYKQSL